MKLNFEINRLNSDPISYQLVEYLRDHEDDLGIKDSQLFYEFPIYKNLDDEVLRLKLLLVSRIKGVLLLTNSNLNGQTKNEDIEYEKKNFISCFDILLSKLTRYSDLKKNKKELSFNVDGYIYAPYLSDENIKVNKEFFFNDLRHLKELFDNIDDNEINDNVFQFLLGIIDGSNALRTEKERGIESKRQFKGFTLIELEQEMKRFDEQQKRTYLNVIEGPQRIRGLAGSGKTVVMAMKAALTHLDYPDANIVYTFYTKSLYQHIKTLIKRFYRQYDDNEPDWDKIRILHAWGGKRIEGVYHEACLANDVRPINYLDASKLSRNPFKYVCKDLLNNEIQPIYDYIFVDEGQDFPTEFFKLCINLVKSKKMMWAYDDLQTIFQAETPSPIEIFGVDKNKRPLVELDEDTVLYKCYRNPREILVCAHAVGLGIYGKKIVQMLENREHWEDIGYKVISGEFEEGSEIIVERPRENSLSTISDNFGKEEIVTVNCFEAYAEEIESIIKSIKKNLKQGLRPDDILVIIADDLNAKLYIRDIEKLLYENDINVNNVHSDSYGLMDFQKDGCVTLSTVYKAKGNEAYMVYIVGIDNLYSTYASVRERNILFAAMTRAKAWINISGVGQSTLELKAEIDKALHNFPNLIFKYPSKEILRVMKRDLKERSIRKLRMERMLDQILSEMPIEDIENFMKQRSIVKGLRKK